MASIERAPNRVLDLTELERTSFRRVLASLDDLLVRHPDAYLHPSKRWEYPWALERLGDLAPGAQVLDAGCGGSIFPFYLAERGWQTTACDLAPPASLASRAGTPHYVAGNLTRLPFADASFDAVFCISVIEHLGHAGAVSAMAELRRVLRPGGRLLLTTDFYADAAAELWYEGPGDPFPVDWGFFDPPTLSQVILAAPGWRVQGALDLRVDWQQTAARMRRFHGYAYTAVGVALERAV